MVQKFLRRDEVERVTGMPRSTIYDKMSKGEFPRAVKIGGRAVGWLETEIAQWQEARIAARDQVKAA